MTSAETLKDAADKFAKNSTSGHSDQKSQSSTRPNVPKYLEHYGISYKIKSNGIGIIYSLENCPFDPAHSWESSIIQQPTGMLIFQCFHDSCKGHTWKEARQIISGNDSLLPFMEGGDSEGTTSSDKPEDWPEPLTLEESLPTVEMLRPEMIPAPFRPWLTDIATRMQTNLDFLAVAAIVAAGSIIGRQCGIYPKKHDNWLVFPNLWAILVGRSAMMKSPASAEAHKPLSRLEVEAHKVHQEAMEKYELEKQVAEIKIVTIKEKLKKAAKVSDSASIAALTEELSGALPKRPVRRRYQTQDGTIEKIGEILIQNPKGILINRDELTGWLRGLDKPGREGDRAFFLEAWNGDRRFTYDRIGRGTLDIEALCLSIFGCATPGGLTDYIRGAIEGGSGDDGLMQRFSMMVWPDGQDDWTNIDRWPDTDAKNRAWEIFQKLAKLELEQ